MTATRQTICLTPEEANLRLPFVAVVSADAAELSARLRDRLAASSRERKRPLPSQIVLNECAVQIAALKAGLAACTADLASVGATADAVSRHVDFPSMRGADEIRLCWLAGEERIEYWHGEREPHAARRPLDVPVPAA